jgi:perosamine synthetase
MSIATSSGTGALHLGRYSLLGVGPGDDVIVPNLTFGATASVVLAVGARPVSR